MQQNPGAPPSGALYDLAYKRYNGIRRSPSSRVLVIARYALAAQWRRRGVKVVLMLSLLALAIGAAGYGVAWWGASQVFGQGGGGMLAGRLGEQMAEFDRAIGLNALKIQWVGTVLLVMMTGAPSIASDLRAGAFQFHFARPVTVGHYLVGRFLGAIGWASLPLVAMLAMLTAERLALGGDPARVAAAALAGLAGVVLRLVCLGSVALGVSSLTRRASLGQAFFVATVMASAIVGKGLSEANDNKAFTALSVTGSSSVVTEVILGISGLHGAAQFVPFAGIAVWSLLGLAVAWWRLNNAEVVKG